MNEVSVDLESIHLIRLVATYKSITEAAEKAGMTQSALSRRIQGIESQLNLKMFDRTTRVVRLTAAGKSLLKDTEAIPNILTAALRRLDEDFLGGEKQIRIGVDKSLSLAHIPGLFHHHSATHTEVKTIISQPARNQILHAVETNQLDLGIVPMSADVGAVSQVYHRMVDEFSLVLSSKMAPPASSKRHFLTWAVNQQWLLPPRNSHSREMIEEWAQSMGIEMRVSMELENVDLMCQLAALGMGVTLVPRRSLAVFPRKKQLQQVKLPKELVRELGVVGAKNVTLSSHVKTFIETILFS